MLVFNDIITVIINYNFISYHLIKNIGFILLLFYIMGNVEKKYGARLERYALYSCTNYKPNMHALLPMGINIARSITSHRREIWEF